MLLYKDSKEVTGKTTKRRKKEGRPRLRCMDDDELDLSNVGVKMENGNRIGNCHEGARPNVKGYSAKEEEEENKISGLAIHF